MAVTLQALAAKRRGDLFVLLIFRLALRLEQVNWDEALEDVPLTAHALSSAQRLFGTDACVNWFDTGLEAEAIGVKLGRNSLGEISARAVAPADLPDPGAFDALFNLASYHGVPVVVVARARLLQAVAQAYAALGAGYIVAPGTQDSRVQAVAPGALSETNASLPQPKGAGRLVATTWEVPADTAPERLADFGARLKR